MITFYVGEYDFSFGDMEVNKIKEEDYEILKNFISYVSNAIENNLDIAYVHPSNLGATPDEENDDLNFIFEKFKVESDGGLEPDFILNYAGTFLFLILDIVKKDERVNAYMETEEYRLDIEREDNYLYLIIDFPNWMVEDICDTEEAYNLNNSMYIGVPVRANQPNGKVLGVRYLGAY